MWATHIQFIDLSWQPGIESSFKISAVTPAKEGQISVSLNQQPFSYLPVSKTKERTSKTEKKSITPPPPPLQKKRKGRDWDQRKELEVIKIFPRLLFCFCLFRGWVGLFCLRHL